MLPLVIIYCLSLSFFSVAIYASPSTLSITQKRLIVDPPIADPTADTVWVVGNKYTVTWSITDLPPLANITNSVGRIVLGQFNGNGEKLYLDEPLAIGFLISDTHVELTCPDVDDGNYMIVLFGTASNTSPQFKITRDPISAILNPSSSPTSSSPSSSSISNGTLTTYSGTSSPAITSVSSGTPSPSPTSSVISSSSSFAGSATIVPLFSSSSLSSSATSAQGDRTSTSPTPTQSDSGAVTKGVTGSAWLSCMAMVAVPLSFLW